MRNSLYLEKWKKAFFIIIINVIVVDAVLSLPYYL